MSKESLRHWRPGSQKNAMQCCKSVPTPVIPAMLSARPHREGEIAAVVIAPVLLAAVAVAGSDLVLLIALVAGSIACLTLGAGFFLVLASLAGLVFHIWRSQRTA